MGFKKVGPTMVTKLSLTFAPETSIEVRAKIEQSLDFLNRWIEENRCDVVDCRLDENGQIILDIFDENGAVITIGPETYYN